MEVNCEAVLWVTFGSNKIQSFLNLRLKYNITQIVRTVIHESKMEIIY